jgi:ribosome biogenesis GTPase A
MTTPAIQWYPGHIAKAQRQLQEQIKKVDVVLEVRDARIPLSTHHPEVAGWIGNKMRLLILNRVDMITPEVRQLWTDWFKTQGELVYYADAKQGTGVAAIMKASQKAGIAVNQRRRDRGMLPRPVRAVVIGFPNVGKSALINRLLKKRVVESARKPGVTRQLRWVRISDELELLDAPGIIPGKLHDQESAVKLAICDDIGEAGYDRQRITAAMVELIKKLGYQESLQEKYAIDPLAMTSEDFIHAVSNDKYLGDLERGSHNILNNFRTGLLGAIPLELPPNCQHRPISKQRNEQPAAVNEIRHNNRNIEPSL